MDQSRGRYSRGYLPHIDAGSATQFLTFRLADSLPASLISAWRCELSTKTDSEQKKEMYSRIEKHLDQGHGSLLLRNPVAGKIVNEAIIFYNGKKYVLHAWCVMPNHVHLLVTPLPGITLTDIVRPLKSYTSKCIHEALGGSGRLWQPDFFDRLIRDSEHQEKVARYIEWNPVKAGLCHDPSLWPFTSFGRIGHDGRLA